MINGASRDIPDITPRFPGDLEPSVVLPQTVGFREVGEVVAAPRLAVGGLERIYLLEEIEVALVAPLEGLVGLFAAKDLLCTLRWVSICAEMEEQSDTHRASRSFSSHGGHSSAPPGRRP